MATGDRFRIQCSGKLHECREIVNREIKPCIGTADSLEQGPGDRVSDLEVLDTHVGSIEQVPGLALLVLHGVDHRAREPGILILRDLMSGDAGRLRTIIVVVLTITADVPYITGAAPVLSGVGPQVMLANSLKEDPDIKSLEVGAHVDSEMIPRSRVTDDGEVAMALSPK